MAISVHIHEYTGRSVALLDLRFDVNHLCATAATDPARYPLLSGVDDHDDTIFNPRQCVPLAAELTQLAGSAGVEPEVREAAGALLRLTDLMHPAPGRPHHRRLVFNGD